MGRTETWLSIPQEELARLCPKMSGTEWKAYTALVAFRNRKTMETVPVGVSLVMAKTGMPRRTAFRAIASLEESGFVEKTVCGNRAIYRFPQA